MNIKRVSGVYFSPTGTTKSVIKHMLAAFDAQQEETDLTPYKNRDNSYSFNEEDLAIIGTPVYGGQEMSAHNRGWQKNPSCGKLSPVK